MASATNTFPKLHNAMWPGLVGKEEGTDHPPISLDRMLELTANASAGGHKFDGVDLFLFHPHTDPDASERFTRAIDGDAPRPSAHPDLFVLLVAQRIVMTHARELLAHVADLDSLHAGDAIQ